MAWQTPKTNWKAGDVPAATDFNRIEGNTAQNRDDLDAHKSETATLSNLAHVKHGTLTATILASGWTGAEAPYSQTVAVAGILATDNPIVDVDISGAADFEEEEALLAAWGLVYRLTTQVDQITVYATDEPEVDIPIQLKVVR